MKNVCQPYDVCLCVLLTTLVAHGEQGPLADSLQTLKSTILRELIPSGPIGNVDKEVAQLLSSLTLNFGGSWPDINYDDADDRSRCFMAEHLRRSFIDHHVRLLRGPLGLEI